MRRVIIGHDASGASVVSGDEHVAALPLQGMGILHRMWSSDEPAVYPDAGKDPAVPGMAPPPGGARFSICEFLPGQTANGGNSELLKSMAWEADNPGMHRTDSTDFDVVLSGEITLDLDQGSVVLRSGDVVVIGGARHRWRNVGTSMAIVAFCRVGAKRAAT